MEPKIILFINCVYEDISTDIQKHLNNYLRGEFNAEIYF